MCRALLLADFSGLDSIAGKIFSCWCRWEPTSQVCSECGYRWGKLNLSVRTIVCVNCGKEHDRDDNASVIIVETRF
ncbi:MAG: zinc ribbon domain-containing protein [Coleofasciculus sp. G3-WIS-01]|uniref:zinc ribbon domain-containing protein n=1 Tax=Coleofasciculus sp. G3-WIS-01 TaxID=3069528 RepID=UPI0033020157